MHTRRHFHGVVCPEGDDSSFRGTARPFRADLPAGAGAGADPIAADPHRTTERLGLPRPDRPCPMLCMSCMSCMSCTSPHVQSMGARVQSKDACQLTRRSLANHPRPFASIHGGVTSGQPAARTRWALHAPHGSHGSQRGGHCGAWTPRPISATMGWRAGRLSRLLVIARYGASSDGTDRTAGATRAGQRTDRADPIAEGRTGRPDRARRSGIGRGGLVGRIGVGTERMADAGAVRESAIHRASLQREHPPDDPAVRVIEEYPRSG